MPNLSPQVQRGIVYGSIWSYLQPRLAKDAQIDYRAIPFHMVSNGNFAKVRPAIEKAVRQASRGKLAQDADIKDLADLLNALSNGNGAEPDYDQDLSPMATAPGAAMPQGLKSSDAEPEDTVAKIKEFLRGQVPDELLAQLDAFQVDTASPAPPPNGGPAPPPNNGEDRRAARDEDDDDKEKAEDEVTPMQEEVLKTDSGNSRVELKGNDRKGSDKKPATDIKAAMDAAIRHERQNQKAIREAERFVRPWVGELPAMDAAGPEDIYRTALKMCGVASADKMHVDALRPVLEAQPKAGDQPRYLPTTLASDGAPSQGFYDRFPTLKGIRVQS
jgi:uncharacterized protein